MSRSAPRAPSLLQLIAPGLVAVVLVTVVLLAALLPACGPGSGAPAPLPLDGPHVVLVLVDQLRKDSFDAWAPATGALAAQGLVAQQMRSVAPWTYPSVISLMSGLYPQQHGADGQLFKNELTTFDAAVPLLPRLLRDRGYHTAGFVTNPFLHTWNPFHTAFDHYDIQFINSQGNRRGKAEQVWTERMFADSVNTAVADYYADRPLDGPEFTYVHYIDVHGPWDDAPFPDDYESAVRWIDGHLVELYELFMARYDGDVLFVITSDHGQALDDDETVGFGRPWRKNKASPHDFNLLIPFVVLPSARVTAPGSYDGPCSNIDVLPTLAEWLGLSLDYAAPGASLLGALRGTGVPDRDDGCYARMSAFKRMNDGFVYAGRKYLRFRDPATREVVARRVFDLSADPRETHPLDDGEFTAIGPLLREAAGTHGLVFEAGDGPLDDGVRGQLETLGYLGGEGDGRSGITEDH